MRAMPGDLAETSPVDVCLHLAGEGATGTLAMSGARGDAVLVFADGRLAGARPPATGRSARLGERLVSAGRLDRPDLDATLADQSAASSTPALGQMLIERGLVSGDVVRLFVQEQVLETLLDAISWFEGSWDFEAASSTPPGSVDVGIPVDRALMEVRRRAAERDRIASVVTSSSLVPRTTTTTAPPDALSADAFTVLTAVDGRRTVASIASTLGFSYDETCRQLYRLVLQGLVTVADVMETTAPDPTPVTIPLPEHEPAPEPAVDVDDTPDPAPEPEPEPEIVHQVEVDADAATEEDALSGFTATGAPVPLADDGWAELRKEAATAVDEPEPWVGWAHGAPAATPDPEPGDAAATAEARLFAEPEPDPEPVAPLWPDAGATDPAVAQPATAPRGDLDADTRRALFSELHEVGRANPSIGNGDAPAAPQVTTPEPVEPVADPGEVDVPDPEPPVSLSSSDVSELLRELHALNLDD